MKEKKTIIYQILRPIGTPIFRFLFRPKYKNLENIPKEGRIILAGNHANNLDAILLISSLKRVIHFLGKIELFQKNQLSNWFFKHVGVIPVNRKQKKNKEAMISAEEVLKNEQVIGIFPEGTFSKTDQLLPFKLGAVAMAQHTDTKIIPFAIKGKYQFLGRTLQIIFGSPIDMNKVSLEEGTKILQKEVEKLLK